MHHVEDTPTYSTLADLIEAARHHSTREVCLRYEADIVPPYTRTVLWIPGDASGRTLATALQVKLAATDPGHDRARLDTMAVAHHEDIKTYLLAAGLRVRIVEED